MNITFNSERFFLSSIAYDFGIDRQTVIRELANEDWQSWSYNTPKGHENPNWNVRYKVQKIKSPVLQKIADFVQSDAVKDQVLDMLYS